MHARSHVTIDFLLKPLSLKRIAALVALCSIVVLAGCSEKSEQTWTHDPEDALFIQLSPDARWSLNATTAGFVNLWALQEHTIVDSWQHTEDNAAGVVAADFSPDSQYVVTAERDNIALYSIKQQKLIKHWGLPHVNTMSLGNDGKYVLVGQAIPHQWENEVIYFDLSVGGIRFQFPHDDKVTAVDLSSDGRYALTGSDDYAVRLWSLADGKLVQNWLHEYKVTLAAISPNSNFVVTGSALDEVVVWDVKSGKRLLTIDDRFITGTTAAFSPDEKRLAIGLQSGLILIVDLEKMKVVKQFRPKRRYFWQPTLPAVASLAFKNNQTLISETSRGIAQQWRL